MSKYTDAMVAELRSFDLVTYEDAVAFADKYPEVSTRSVISKVKNLEIPYQPKAKPTANATVQVRKADVVEAIATAIGVNFELVEGLAKADKRSLEALLKAVA